MDLNTSFLIPIHFLPFQSTLGHRSETESSRADADADDVREISESDYPDDPSSGGEGGPPSIVVFQVVLQVSVSHSSKGASY